MDDDLKLKVENFISDYDAGHRPLKSNADNYNVMVELNHYTIPVALAHTLLAYRKSRKYENSKEYTQQRDFQKALDNLLKVIEYIDAHNLTDRNADRELQESKELCVSLKTQLSDSDSTIKQLENELIKIKSVIDAAVRANPHLRPFFNFDQMTEVEEMDDESR